MNNHQTNRKRLVKTKTVIAPSYEIFQDLLRLHDNKIDKAFLNHFHSDALQMLLYAFRNNSKYITESRYNYVLDNLSKLENVIDDCLEGKLQLRDQYMLEFIVGYKTTSMSVKDIAINLHIAPKTVYKHLNSASSILSDYISSNFFEDSVKNISNKLNNVNPKAYKWITRSIEDEPYRRECVKQIVKKCQLDWTLPTSGRELDWLPYYVSVGTMFGCVSLKTGIGARMYLLKYAPEAIHYERVKWHIDDASSQPLESYRHSLRLFVKYVKSHKDLFPNP